MAYFIEGQWKTDKDIRIRMSGHSSYANTVRSRGVNNVHYLPCLGPILMHLFLEVNTPDSVTIGAYWDPYV